MCGLLYGRRRDNRSVVKSALRRYEKQKGRGTQGFGYIVVKNGKIQDIKRAKYEYYIKGFLDKEDGASEILFHHRQPTSTENLEEMTHPIVVKSHLLDHNYYVIHNGVLTNEDELKVKYEAMGFAYTTTIKKRTITEIAGKVTEESETVGFNDSESFAIDLALFLDNKKTSIESVGSIAFICYQTDKEDNIIKIHYGRNSGNPLVVEDNNDLFFIKSSGGGKEIDEDTLFSIDYKTNKVSEAKVSIGKRTEFGYYAGKEEKENSESPTRSLSLPLLPEKEDFQDVHRRYSEDDDDYGGVESYYSMKKYEDGLAEIAQLEADISFAKSELRNRETKYQEKLYYKESLIADTRKLKTLEDEIDFLKDFFGD